MNTKQILLAAADVLAQPRSWTTQKYAKISPESTDQENEGIWDLDKSWGENVRDPRFTCFCAVGAIYRVADDDEAALAAVDAFGSTFKDHYTVPRNSVFSFNDGADQETVVAKLREVADGL